MKILSLFAVFALLLVSPAFAQSNAGAKKAENGFSAKMNTLAKLLGEKRDAVCPKQTGPVGQEFCSVEFDTVITMVIGVNVVMLGAEVSAISGDKPGANAKLKRVEEGSAKLKARIAELNKKYK